MSDYWFDRQAAAWVTFDENDACRTCGAQVTESHQVTHYEWHEALEGSAKTADTPATVNRKKAHVAQTNDD